MGTVSDWSVQALRDGKVTTTEANDLAVRVCKILNIPLEIDLTKET